MRDGNKDKSLNQSESCSFTLLSLSIYCSRGEDDDLLELTDSTHTLLDDLLLHNHTLRPLPSIRPASRSHRLPYRGSTGSRSPGTDCPSGSPSLHWSCERTARHRHCGPGRPLSDPWSRPHPASAAPALMSSPLYRPHPFHDSRLCVKRKLWEVPDGSFL